MARELPRWAQEELGKMGIDDASTFEDELYGPIADRKSGLRRDDLVEILLDARSISEEIDPWIRGRLLSSHKSSIEILDDDASTIPHHFWGPLEHNQLRVISYRLYLY